MKGFFDHDSKQISDIELQSNPNSYHPPSQTHSSINDNGEELDPKSLAPFDFENIKILEELGQGGFGIVHKALSHIDRKNKKFLALKSPTTPWSELDPKNKKMLMTEIQILKEITNLNDLTFH